MRDDEMPLVTSYFSVRGRDFDPDEFTRAVRIEPSEVQPLRAAGTYATGEPHFLPPIWWLKRTKEPRLTIDEGLKVVIDQIWDRRQVIRSFVADRKLDAHFGTNVTIERLRPEYILSADTIQRLAEFHCPWFLDIIS